MKDCAVEPKVASMLPDFALNAHGNLAQQNRLVGAQRGLNTGGSRPAPRRRPATTGAARPPRGGAAGRTARRVQALMQKNNCVACHAIDRKLVGPSWTDIAKKHAGKADYLAGKIRSGGSGVWGAIPMPPQTLADEDARRDRELARGRRGPDVAGYRPRESIRPLIDRIQ